MNSPNELLSLSATQMTQAISNGEISALEVFETHISQIEAENPAINALVTTCFERGLEEAKSIDKKIKSGGTVGRLCGLPYAVKDTLATAGLKTTYGSRIYANNVPASDAIHVARARAAGAIVIGKSNTPEFASGCQTNNAIFGLTRNPNDTNKTVTGSSGGAAAALAAHLVPMADGSDLGGSLRSPASVCGVVGFRPTAGQVPKLQDKIPFDPLHVFGPMAKCVEDIALFMSVFSGLDKRCPLSAIAARIDYSAALEIGHANCRIAWSTNPCGSNTHPEVVTEMEKQLGIFRSIGCRVDDACPQISDNHHAHQIIVALNAITELGEFIDDERLGSSARLRGFLESGRKLTAQSIAEARRIQAHSWEIIQTFFNDYEFMVWPTMSGLPYSASINEDEVSEDWKPVELTPSLNLPAIAIPAGFSQQGLPIGIQIIGPPNSDLRLLQLAFAFQQAKLN